MKKYLFFLMAIVFVSTSCKKTGLEGNGSIITETRDVKDFYNVTVSGSSKVFIKQGNTYSVEVRVYQNLMPYIETKVQDGNLLIKYNTSGNVTNDNSEIYITMPTLNGVTVNGDGAINVTGPFVGTENFSTILSGSGSIYVAGGIATNLRVNLSGSGNVKAYGLSVQRADITISGSSNAEVTVAQTLNVNISGSGNVYYKGNAPSVTSKITGSGQVVKQ